MKAREGMQEGMGREGCGRNAAAIASAIEMDAAAARRESERDTDPIQSGARQSKSARRGTGGQLRSMARDWKERRIDCLLLRRLLLLLLLHLIDESLLVLSDGSLMDLDRLIIADPDLLGDLIDESEVV